MAVAVFMGPRDTAGYAVSIDRAQVQGGDLVIGYREQVPGPAQVVALVRTSPYAVRLLPKTDGAPKFQREK
ncbi:protease complex subunit PrcB family protein [Azospirillum thermophilum]|uniref:protease complex subunit PrcB family protein n=1 Tax=Azospirillum thermophilum TaxID=2202148 RepID=UPI001FE7A2E6|nr:protease complex subunit PrcB family protein [Azospirillum thermophilum]